MARSTQSRACKSVPRRFQPSSISSSSPSGHILGPLHPLDIPNNVKNFCKTPVTASLRSTGEQHRRQCRCVLPSLASLGKPDELDSALVVGECVSQSPKATARISSGRLQPLLLLPSDDTTEHHDSLSSRVCFNRRAGQSPMNSTGDGGTEGAYLQCPKANARVSSGRGLRSRRRSYSRLKAARKLSPKRHDGRCSKSMTGSWKWRP